MAEHTLEANVRAGHPHYRTVTAAKNIESLSRVDGAEIFIFGPADFPRPLATGQWKDLGCRRTPEG